MIVLFIHLLTATFIWTGFTLLGKGAKHEELVFALNDILEKIKILNKSFYNLIRILLQDLLLDNNADNKKLKQGNNLYPREINDINGIKSKKWVTQKPSLNDQPDIAEDVALSCFSQKVIEVINEEEDKVA